MLSLHRKVCKLNKHHTEKQFSVNDPKCLLQLRRSQRDQTIYVWAKLELMSSPRRLLQLTALVHPSTVVLQHQSLKAIMFQAKPLLSLILVEPEVLMLETSSGKRESMVAKSTLFLLQQFLRTHGLELTNSLTRYLTSVATSELWTRMLLRPFLIWIWLSSLTKSSFNLNRWAVKRNAWIHPQPF